MRIGIFGTVTAIALTGLAQPAPSQQQAPRVPPAHGVTMAQKQTPFIAEFKVTRVRTLADGTTTTQEMTEVKAADSQGRTMTSTTNPSRAAGQPATTSVSVFDPMTQTRTTWTSSGQRAAVTPVAPVRIPRDGEPHPQCPVSAPSPKREFQTEDLGTETIDGVEAHGRRVTITAPASADGNTAPMVRVHETWTSMTMRLTVREINDSPDTGKTTTELTSLTLSDPPLSTFQPPEGYEVVNRDPPVQTCPAVQAAPVTSPVAQ